VIALSRKDSKTIGDSLEKTKEYHLRYLRAVNNPLRRRILWILREGDATIETLQSKMGLDTETLEWHLRMLEDGFCVEKENRDGETFYKLTKEGKVVEYIER
jgi:DNA-binding transcriptional ArsR family regulator